MFDSLPSSRPARIAALLTFLIGAFALLGWYFDISVTDSEQPVFAIMPPNTAFALILAAAALWLIAEGRSRLLNDFVTCTLHDLRTPLASIDTSAYIIQRLENPAKRGERAENILEQVQHIARTLDINLPRWCA